MYVCVCVCVFKRTKRDGNENAVFFILQKCLWDSIQMNGHKIKLKMNQTKDMYVILR